MRRTVYYITHQVEIEYVHIQLQFMYIMYTCLHAPAPSRASNWYRCGSPQCIASAISRAQPSIGTDRIQPVYKIRVGACVYVCLCNVL